MLSNSLECLCHFTCRNAITLWRLCCRVMRDAMQEIGKHQVSRWQFYMIVHLRKARLNNSRTTGKNRKLEILSGILISQKRSGGYSKLAGGHNLPPTSLINTLTKYCTSLLNEVQFSERYFLHTVALSNWQTKKNFTDGKFPHGSIHRILRSVSVRMYWAWLIIQNIHHVGGYGFIFVEPDLGPGKINSRILWNAYLCVTVCLCFLVTGADYPHPPRDDVEYLSPRRAPRSKYRYLDSDGALLKTPVWPMPSETKVWRPWRHLNSFDSFVSNSAC